MSRIVAEITMELLSDTIFSSGNSVPGGVDITLRTDSQGHPYLPGSTLKGLLREALGNYLCWTQTGTREDLNELMGGKGIRSVESERRLVFGDLRLERRELREEDCSHLRAFTRLKNGAAAPGSLHSALSINHGYKMTGLMICARQDIPLLQNAFRLIQSVGLKRSRGFGSVAFSFRERELVASCAPVPEGNWIHYRLRLYAPLFIAQGTIAPTDRDRENYSAGADHIPGSAIRGMILSQLAAEDPQWFDDNKQALLQQVIFRSAFPMEDGMRQIPTPLGFYENRGKTRFYHVLNQEVEAGDKRARLGRYCRMQKGQLLHCSPVMESSLRITLTDAETRQPLNAGERQMFTNEVIAEGTVMEGWAYVPDPGLTPRIAGAFKNWICLGADRFGGSGLCRMELLDGTPPNDEDFAYRDTDAVPETLCMMMLTPTALMCDGEVCGLTDETAAALLGVRHAEIQRYATSIVQHSGFNRRWGCALPTVSMYAPGSVFRIQCSEAPSLERLRELELHGIGIRRSEGCGQVLFLRDFFNIQSHTRLEHSSSMRAADSQKSIEQRRAKYRWLMKNKIEGGLSDSQCGSLQAMCRNVLHGRMEFGTLKAFFMGKINQSTQEEANYAVAWRQFSDIMNTPLYSTLGCPAFEDTWEDRLALYCELFDMERKEESR